MRLSGFTFVHNAIEGGYPIVEAIEAVYPFVDEVLVVDMESTDQTMEVLANATKKLELYRLYKRQGEWIPGAAGECLKKAHALHRHCTGDVIVHFEADEVFDPRLVDEIHYHLERERYDNMLVWRLQVEQNFQRIRWYPELVHRVFPNNETAVKRGHTTEYHDAHQDIYQVEPKHGFLWDVTNCFRDDWIQRYRNQAELWGSEVRHRWVGIHASAAWFDFGDDDLARDVVGNMLKQPHWTWGRSPIALPGSLSGMVGCPSYAEHLKRRGLL